jgi:hypothetical protein
VPSVAALQQVLAVISGAIVGFTLGAAVYMLAVDISAMRLKAQVQNGRVGKVSTVSKVSKVGERPPVSV